MRTETIKIYKFEELTSEECVTESLIANELEFLEDGTTY